MKKGFSSLTLLDVSVLLPLAWPNHQFHGYAAAYMDQWQGEWATCAITQLGFVRLSSNPSIVGSVVMPSEARRILRGMTDDASHRYLEGLAPPVETELLDRILGHRQTTDAYLVALAERHEAEFATFNTRLAALSDRVRVLDPSIVQ